jgi:hypothetical protein
MGTKETQYLQFNQINFYKHITLLNYSEQEYDNKIINNFIRLDKLKLFCLSQSLLIFYEFIKTHQGS